MSLNCRLTNVVHDAERGCVYAVDDKGLVHAFDESLRLIRQSPATSHGVALHGICDDLHYVYTRDVAGNVVRWSKDRLEPLEFILSQHYVSAEEESLNPVPCPSHGIVATNDHLIFCNSRGSLTVLNKSDMSYAWSQDVSESAFIEHLSVDAKGSGDALLVIDVVGRVFRYSLKTREVELLAEVFCGVSHSIGFDRIHQRYWITSDVGAGIYLLDDSTRALTPLRFTNDDVEEIVISEDQSRVFVACFDHHVYVCANTEIPEVIGTIGPFKFQVNHLKSMGPDRLLAMLESGELYVVDTRNGEISSSVGGTSAYWDILLSGDSLLCTSESGIVDRYQISSAHKDFALKKGVPIHPAVATKRMRISVTSGANLISVCSNGHVVCFDREGSLCWDVELRGILRDIALSNDGRRVAVASETGWLVVLSADSGELVAELKNNRPIWCVHYAHDGQLVFGERELKSEEPSRTESRLVFLDGETLEFRHSIPGFGNNKRIRSLPGGNLLVSGNGKTGVRIINPADHTVIRSFSDWQINTPENSVLVGDLLYVVTYGFQLLTYEVASGQVVDVQFILEGYPKGMVAYTNESGINFIVVSCRNALMTFCVAGGTPELVMTRYLYDSYYCDHSAGAAFQAMKGSTNYSATVIA